MNHQNYKSDDKYNPLSQFWSDKYQTNPSPMTKRVTILFSLKGGDQLSYNNVDNEYLNKYKKIIYVLF
jgi:hypothetical protein